MLLTLFGAGVGCRSELSTSQDSAADAREDTLAPEDQSAPDVAASDADAALPDGPSPPDQAADHSVATPSCAELETQFLQALESAAECTVGCNCCTAKVIGIVHPGCPCPIFINAQNTQQAATMRDLRNEFAALSCPGPTCKCKEPASAICTQLPGAAVGTCLNTF